MLVTNKKTDGVIACIKINKNRNKQLGIILLAYLGKKIY